MPNLNLDGTHLYYETLGSGAPLLLLNGIGLELHAWGLAPDGVPFPGSFADALARERRVVLVDACGAGRSGPVHLPCTTSKMAADALTLINHLALGPVDVLGLSMGGLVAQELSLLAPRAVRGLVLAATAARLPGRSRRVVDTWRRFLLTGANADALGREQVSWVFGPQTLDNDALTEGILAAMAAGPAIQPEGFSAHADACLGHDSRTQAARITAPALVLCGRDDILIPHAASEELAKALPRARTTMLAGGHAFLMESPEAAAAAVLAFLQELDANG